jgi:hypothetical protein
MTKTKPKTNKEVKDYIKKAISEITTFVPIIQMWQVIWEDDDTNPSNGEFSVGYEPANFHAEFHIYQNLFDQIPDEGLTEGFKHYIKAGLGHEVGHLYIYELEGTKRDIEKVASLIGLLIHEILDSRGI